jgi:hypothetical protein
MEAGARAFKGKLVAQRHGVHDRLQFVIAISPLSQDVEQKVDLAA